MNVLKEMRDDQIRVIGESGKSVSDKSGTRFKWIIISALIVLVVIAGIISLVIVNNPADSVSAPEPSYFEPKEVTPDTTFVASFAAKQQVGIVVDSHAKGFVELKDTVVNDVNMRIYIPHNAEMSLHIGMPDNRDPKIIYVAQAADIRADNGGIVGAFVLKGVPRSWGISKKGFCAVIGGEITIGVADNSPLFEKATEMEGYFFRQFPLVAEGKLIENNPKGKSIRRGICDRNGEIFMIETTTKESFHDFSQALVDMGISNAIYIVGGDSAYGWAVDVNGVAHEFGNRSYLENRHRLPENINYIVWKRK